MAVIAGALTYPPTGSANGERSVVVVTWPLVLTADTCGPVEIPGYADKTIQVVGTMDSVSVSLQGSNDGTNYFALNTMAPVAGAIALTVTNTGSIVLENTLWVKPVTASGGASQSITVILVAKR